MFGRLFVILLLFTVSSTLYTEEIVYGIVPDASPTTFIDENGVPSGLFVDLFGRIMDELGISYRYEIAPFASLYPGMISGEIHLFTALIKNPQREKLFYFPEIPVISGWGQLFIASDTEYTEIQQLNGKKIGIIANDINGINFKRFASNLGIIYSIKEYLTFSDLLNGVRSGEVFAGVVYNSSLADAEGVKSTSTVFNPMPGYAVTAKGSGFEKDLDRIMQRFNELKNNNNSYYYDLIRKWFYRTEKVNSKIYILLISLVILFSTAVMIMYLINRYLKSEVMKRTKDLEFSNRIVSNSAEGIMITDSSAMILKVNPGFTRITGYTEKEVVGKNPSVLQSGVHDNTFYMELWDSLIETGSWKGEITNKRKNGEQYIQSTSIVSIRDNKGDISNFASIIADDTIRHIYEEQLEYQANYDQLTGLLNRKSFTECLEHDVISAFKSNSYILLVLIDIDNFKNFNDAYGHAHGDKMLKAVSLLLKENLTEACCLARLGGDEFAVVFMVSDRSYVEKYSEKIHSLFKTALSIDKNFMVHVTVSLGTAVFPDNTTDHYELYKQADIAINSGKKEGRGRITGYRDDMDLHVQKKIRYENMIRNALDRNEIYVLYQPKLDLKNKRISGVEALVRWKLDNDKVIPPDEFISIAEETGMIIPIGEYVLKQTCLDIGEINKKLEYSISAAVNLSGIQFSGPDLAGNILNIIKETEFDPRLLEFEITESVAVNHLDEVYSVLGNLRNNSIHIAMDDFGTGFSSLSYLKDLPLDILKIDKAFTQNIPDLVNDTEVVKLIISMAEILGLKVVAEGVETSGQLDYLYSQKCWEIQGYILSPPVTVNELDSMISDFDYDKWFENIK